MALKARIIPVTYIIVLASHVKVEGDNAVNTYGISDECTYTNQEPNLPSLELNLVDGQKIQNGIMAVGALRIPAFVRDSLTNLGLEVWTKMNIEAIGGFVSSWDYTKGSTFWFGSTRGLYSLIRI